MAWYLQLVFYVLGVAIAAGALWQVDFAKFIRSDRRQLATVVYVVLSLAVGGMVGFLFVQIGTAISAATG